MPVAIREGPGRPVSYSNASSRPKHRTRRVWHEAAIKKRYDATVRDLFEPEPAAWLEFFGIPVPDPGQAQVIDSNVSTVTAETDKLLRRGGPDPVILHLEFLSGRNKGYPRHVHWY